MTITGLELEVALAVLRLARRTPVTANVEDAEERTEDCAVRYPRSARKPDMDWDGYGRTRVRKRWDDL